MGSSHLHQSYSCFLTTPCITEYFNYRLSILQRSGRITQVFMDKLCSILCWDLRNYFFGYLCITYLWYSISAAQNLPSKSMKPLLRTGVLGTSLLGHLPHHPVPSKSCNGEGWSAVWLIFPQETAPKSYWTATAQPEQRDTPRLPLHHCSYSKAA